MEILTKMPLYKRLAMIALGTTMIAIGACTQEPTAPGSDTSVEPADTPPIPANVGVQVSPHQVVVSWEVDDPTDLTYRVYRARGLGPFGLLGTTANLAYTDASVETGGTYRYQVSAVRSGLEGLRSVTATAIPNTFAIVLDGGVDVTAANDVVPGSRKIVVGLVAPETTVSFRLSEHPLLVGAAVQSYDPLLAVGLFTLSAGDGIKTVYGQFVDADGAESAIVSATIRLDTKAVIELVTEDSAGATLSVNDILHVAVTVDTTGGVVTVTLDGVLEAADLFDDGTNGDVTAFDGTYERDFLIPAGVEVHRGVVFASFQDVVGNVAAVLGSATRVTVADPPEMPTWETNRISVQGTDIDLFWFQNLDADFGFYRIYRAAGTTVSITDELVLLENTRNVVSFTDTVPAAGQYTWGILVIDDFGFWSPMATTTHTLP